MKVESKHYEDENVKYMYIKFQGGFFFVNESVITTKKITKIGTKT